MTKFIKTRSYLSLLIDVLINSFLSILHSLWRTELFCIDLYAVVDCLILIGQSCVHFYRILLAVEIMPGLEDLLEAAGAAGHGALDYLAE